MHLPMWPPPYAPHRLTFPCGHVASAHCPPPHAPQDVPAPVLPKDVTDAFDTAYANIKAFHEAQHSAPIEVETMPGVRCRRLTRPIGEG